MFRAKCLCMACIVIAIFLGSCQTGLDEPTAEASKQTKATKQIEVTIDAEKVGEPISKYIYGQFIEHLGRCIYGGIWAEMIEDRKFYYPITDDFNPWATASDPQWAAGPYKYLKASPWKVIGPAGTVTMDSTNPYVGEHSPVINLPGDGTIGGISQGGLALVKDKKYVGRIILAGDQSALPVWVRLVLDDGKTIGQVINKMSSEFQAYPLIFTAPSSSENAKIEIYSEGSGKFKIGTLSLMPADNIKGMRADTLELLKKLNAPMYRWPGGNFVSGYDWRDGIGDRDHRPPRKNPAWKGVESNDFGFHEFIYFCRLLNAEPLVTVNTGFGDAYSAAAQLEYANGSTDSLMGALRAKNGDTKPFNVRYWAIGNEMWGNWQLGYMKLEHYILKHNWVVDKMREIDPDIIPIASGNAGRWSEGLLKSCSDHIDLIAEHFYCKEKLDPVEHAAQIADNIKQRVQFHKELRQKLDTLKGKDIRIAMTEWNYWYGNYIYGELGVRYHLKDALGIAKGLHEYFRNSDIIFLANYAQTVNVIGCIKTTKTAACFATTGLPLMLYRNEFGVLPVQVEQTEAALDIAAALTEDKKMLTIGIVNPTNDTYQVNMNLESAEPVGKAKSWIITGNDPMAYNEPGKIPNVEVVQTEATNIAKTITVAPFSVTLYKVAVK